LGCCPGFIWTLVTPLSPRNYLQFLNKVIFKYLSQALRSFLPKCHKWLQIRIVYVAYILSQRKSSKIMKLHNMRQSWGRVLGLRPQIFGMGWSWGLH